MNRSATVSREAYQRIREENEELFAENLRLKQQLFGDFEIPHDWKLTRRERKIFGCLLAATLAKKETLIEAVFGLYDEPASADDNIKVSIFNMRKKLNPLGIKIKVQWGVGYYLEPETRNKLREELNGRTAH
ncbi:helix-turn-helix domain-containing protein [Roseibium alexandrii]|uniref:helix-turn-helix domain-containing protein n=1 Tax=Roseibium alexandrii TaxID=388408 RepID=UPI0037509EC6